MVILCTALEARADAKETGRRFGVSVGADGFFIERHPKLGPVSTPTDGVFIAGACQGPKDIPDSVAQGGAAAAARHVADGPRRGGDGRRLRRESTRSCLQRVPDVQRPCPYSAIGFDEARKVSA